MTDNEKSILRCIHELKTSSFLGEIENRNAKEECAKTFRIMAAFIEAGAYGDDPSVKASFDDDGNTKKVIFTMSYKP